MQYRLVRRVLATALVAAGASAWAYAGGDRPPEASAAAVAESSATVTVFKDPGCGCCNEWVSHLKKHSFRVIARDTGDVTAIKLAARVPLGLYSCHTAFLNGYVVEGHVPAADIHRLLKEKPKIAGIAVAGMPIGSPGMEVGNRKDPYEVIAFSRDGSTSVYARH